MSRYKNKYTLSYAIIIDTYPIRRNEDTNLLAGILERHPYQFTVTYLSGNSATYASIRDILDNLSSIDADAQILIYLAGESLSDVDDLMYFCCSDTNSNNLQVSAIPYTNIFTLPQVTKAKHIGLILDTSINLKSIEQYIEVGGSPEWDMPLERKAYQLILRNIESNCPNLISAILKHLNSSQKLQAVSMFSLGYHLAEQCSTHSIFCLKGSEGGNFIFYDPPLAHLPKELREALIHTDAPIRWIAISEAENYFESVQFREYIELTLKEIAILDTNDNVRLRAIEALNRQGHFRSIDLNYQTKAVKEVLGEPFEWAFIPVGRTTLVDRIYLSEADGRIISTPREYVPENEENYLPRGGKTYNVDRFAIGIYPITQSQFNSFVLDDYDNPDWWKYNPNAFDWYSNQKSMENNFAKTNTKYPCTNVTWYEAVAFCLWLSSKTGLSIMLPDELQWQRAAQGDDRRLYSWGNSVPNNELAHWKSHKPARVDSYNQQAHQNSYGLFHMSGNIMEWCISEPSSGNVNIGFSESKHRVIRGGAWNSTSEIELQVSFRQPLAEKTRNLSTGFRIICLLT